jgi:hypothetical protein
VSQWIFFMHPERDDFMETMTDAEVLAFGAHAEWLQGLVADGSLILAGPCLGRENTGSSSSRQRTGRPPDASSRKSL